MIKLHIEGMTCGHCAKHVTESLQAVEGVDSAKVDLQAKEATVTGQANLQALISAVEAEGYSARAN